MGRLFENVTFDYQAEMEYMRNKMREMDECCKQMKEEKEKELEEQIKRMEKENKKRL